jgi:glycosyltransferase involved in cell wall biosynthesis
MRIGLIVPGGVDRSAEYRVIPVLLAYIRRLARRHEVRVIALHQDPVPAHWPLLGAEVQNIGAGHTGERAVRNICAQHRQRRFDVLHAFWSGSPGLVAVLAARLLRIPSVVHVAGGEPVALRDIAYGGRLSWRGRLREACVLRAATAVTAASGPMVAALGALGVSARQIPLGVDLEWWPPRAPRPRVPGAVARLIHVASLNRVKDQPTLLRALRLLRDARLDFSLDLIGEDTLRGEIQALARELGLAGQVQFHGFLPQRALRALMEAADLQVLSSRHEAGPIALLEAAVAGVPTVGTAVGQIADWAPEAALMSAVSDARALAQNAAFLLADEARRMSLAQAAHQRAQRECADYTARAFETLYSELTAQR